MVKHKVKTLPNSVFIKMDKTADDGSSSVFSRTIWASDRRHIAGTEIGAFLLLDGFGDDPAAITQFVADTLLKELLDSPTLAAIVSQIAKSGERWAWSQCQTFNHTGVIEIQIKRSPQIDQFISDTFHHVDSSAYDALFGNLLAGEARSGQNDEQRQQLSLMNSGCSAILALILGRQLVLANCGNSLGLFCLDSSDGLLTAVRVSELHEGSSTATATEAGGAAAVPFRCFGAFAHKTGGLKGMAAAATAAAVSVRPTIQRPIELYHSARFLLFVTAPLWRLIQRHFCKENDQSLDIALANFVAGAECHKEEGNWAQHIQSAIAKVLSGCAGEEMSSSLALAIVDFAKTDFDRGEEGQHENDCCSSTNVSNSVPSEVDWSEFNTHHLREENRRGAANGTLASNVQPSANVRPQMSVRKCRTAIPAYSSLNA
uniref:PPM-type phosphatase domain-containing protein n=1 Tax=Globodera rostochiensis TaxID=31243 RepID=A0A914H537_GLORO